MNQKYIIPRDVLDKVFGGNPRARNAFELFQSQFATVEAYTTANVEATTQLVDASYVTLSANAELPNERVLEVSPGLALTLSDGRVRLSLDDNAARAAGGRVTLVAEGQSRVAVPVEGHLITREEVAALVMSGTGSPEGVVTAPVGRLYLRTDGGAGTSMYIKESGTGNTGWVGK